MADELKKLANTPAPATAELSTFQSKDWHERETLVSRIDDSIAQSDDMARQYFLTQLRREIIEQDLHVLRKRDDVARRKRNFWFKVGFCGSTLGLGVGILLLGYWYAAFFLLGAGLFAVVPEYVRQFMRQNANALSESEDE